MSANLSRVVVEHKEVLGMSESDALHLVKRTLREFATACGLKARVDYSRYNKANWDEKADPTEYEAVKARLENGRTLMFYPEGGCIIMDVVREHYTPAEKRLIDELDELRLFRHIQIDRPAEGATEMSAKSIKLVVAYKEVLGMHENEALHFVKRTLREFATACGLKASVDYSSYNKADRDEKADPTEYGAVDAVLANGPNLVFYSAGGCIFVDVRRQHYTPAEKR